MTQAKRLGELYKIQNEIQLVQHLNPNDYWGVRCNYLDEFYSSHPKYKWNHRCILNNEIVIEYDTNDVSLNKELAVIARDNLHKDNFKTSLWFSGNKSYHLHFFINTKNAGKLNTLKRCILKYYGTITKDKVYLPDLAMAGSHNIRLEYGVHEKTKAIKHLVHQDEGYFTLGVLPDIIWEEYTKAIRRELSAEIEYHGFDLSESPKLKLLLDTANFKKNDDGRERALFILIHVLKSKYTLPELTIFLQTWYRYSGGIKLSEVDIEHKVRYHWKRNYIITYTNLENLLYEIGME